MSSNHTKVCCIYILSFQPRKNTLRWHLHRLRATPRIFWMNNVDCSRLHVELWQAPLQFSHFHFFLTDFKYQCQDKTSNKIMLPALWLCFCGLQRWYMEVFRWTKCMCASKGTWGMRPGHLASTAAILTFHGATFLCVSLCNRRSLFIATHVICGGRAGWMIFPLPMKGQV